MIDDAIQTQSKRNPNVIEAQGWVVYIGGKCLDRWGNQRDWPEVGWLNPTIEEARAARDKWGVSWERRIVRVTRTRMQVPFSAALKRGAR